MVEFDDVETPEVYASSDQLDQLVGMLGQHKDIITDKLEIETSEGHTLVISSDAGYSNITIEEKDEESEEKQE